MANATPSKTDRPKPQKKPFHIKIYYDERDGSYWYQHKGRYLSMTKQTLQMQLRPLGLSDIEWIKEGEGQIKEIDWPFWNAVANNGVAYAGPLAGHRAGVYTDSAKRCYLVTEEAAGIWDDLPKKVQEPEFFCAFIEELLPGDQWQYFCYWLALSLRSLRRGDFSPGQVVGLAGPAQCGKSLLQNIITEVLGGRAANPFRYMMGLTQFNKDLAKAEHWQMEDPASSTDLRTRRQFGAMLKEVSVNRDLSIHGKGKDAELLLPILRRCTVSVNNESECVAIFPPMEPSIKDKIFLFKCDPVRKAFSPFRTVNGTRPLPGMEHTGQPDRKAVWETVVKELPTIRAWLLARYTNVPERFGDDRFGIVAYHHSELIADLMDLSPEIRLLQLIDEVCFDEKFTEPIKLKSMEIEKQLRGSSFGFECDRLLRYSGALAAYLGKLAKAQPDRVKKTTVHGYVFWTITTPKTNSTNTNEQSDNDGPSDA